MADSIDRLVTQLDRVMTAKDSQGMQVEYGNFVAAEDVDPDLSIVILNGKTLRWIPKLKNVESLEENEIVVIMSGAGMLKTIIGVHVGDITLANIEE